MGVVGKPTTVQQTLISPMIGLNIPFEHLSLTISAAVRLLIHGRHSWILGQDFRHCLEHFGKKHTIFGHDLDFLKFWRGNQGEHTQQPRKNMENLRTSDDIWF